MCTSKSDWVAPQTRVLETVRSEPRGCELPVDGQLPPTGQEDWQMALARSTHPTRPLSHQ